MYCSYGEAYLCEFPDSDEVLNKITPKDIAVIKEKATQYIYILTHQTKAWLMLADSKAETDNKAEWVMTLDDFENGWGERKYPHCSNCGRGVYVHDAGKWCPFCGKPMKNPMR